MRSSSGEHFIALDHVRALAAFMVVSWHFIHELNGYPVPFNYVPTVFPLTLLDEGHTGVALFVTLSGYLFSKLLDGKKIHFGPFIWNRVLRLLPLLMVVLIIVGVERVTSGEISCLNYVQSMGIGLLAPTLPHGGWSVVVELHYYVLLPILLRIITKAKSMPLLIVVAAIMLRLFIYNMTGSVQSVAYYSIVGRIDQFILGMVGFQFRRRLAGHHVLSVTALVGFMMFYWYFDLNGGFYENRGFPSTSPIWIVLPTLEGVAYAVGIAWYDNSFSHSTAGLSKFIGRIGELSYSTYLLHFFVVFHASRFVNERLMGITGFYLACAWSVLFLVFMMLPSYVSHRFIEIPFLKLRRRYIIGASPDLSTPPAV